MVLLDSVYINQSGGKILLEYFIKNIQNRGILDKFFFLFDSRLDSSLLNKICPSHQVRITASEANRKKFYKNLSGEISTIFCFANVPPPFRVEIPVYILFHNALLLNNRKMYYSFNTRVKFFLKAIYIMHRSSERYRWLVQTKSMYNLLSRKMKIKKEMIDILPFYEEARFGSLNDQQKSNDINFLYVADGVAQKNHKILLSAWEIIFDKHNLSLNLHLTIPTQYHLLITEIERLQNKGLNVINHGRCDFKELQELYRRCNFFVAPSLTESFGLPIIESAEAGCEVIAADLEYVYDIVDPLATFDPHNKKDIAEKVIAAYNRTYSTKTKLAITNKIYKLIDLITKDV